MNETKYFIAKDVESEIERLCKFDGLIKKGDCVVVPNMHDEPVTAMVTKMTTRYNAITSGHIIKEVIAYVDIEKWQAKREKELENKILLEKMHSRIDDIKLRKTLEKFAGEDAEMRELLTEFNKEFAPTSPVSNTIELEDETDDE